MFFLSAPHRVLLSMPAEAGRVFVAAAALGTQRGIVTPAGRIPLDPDPLFFLSVSAPSVFKGFAGRFSSGGAAELRIRIPAVKALEGLRFHLAAITVTPNRIARITEPFGITIR